MPKQYLSNVWNEKNPRQAMTHSSPSNKPLPPLPAESPASYRLEDTHRYNKRLPLTPISPPTTPEEHSLSNDKRPSIFKLPAAPYSLENPYLTTLSLNPELRKLLETYSGIHASRIERHIQTICEEAWQIDRHPSIGSTCDLLTARIHENLHYPVILKRLKEGDRFLNLRMGLGAELRRLVVDGVRSENLFGCANNPEFINLSYPLFRDITTLKSTFLADDILGASPGLLEEFNGTVDVVYADRLQLQSYEEHVIAAKRMVRFLRGEGSVIVGRQIGHVEAGDKMWQPSRSRKIYCHNEARFRKLWLEIGKSVGYRFKVSVAMWQFLPTDVAELEAMEAQCGWADPGLRWLSYEVVWGEVGLGDMLDVYVDSDAGKKGKREIVM